MHKAHVTKSPHGLHAHVEISYALFNSPNKNSVTRSPNISYIVRVKLTTLQGSAYLIERTR